MKSARTLSVIACIALLVACGSTPRSDYYMLSADAQGKPGTTGPSLGVGPISVPEYLNMREMVLNRSDHKLKLADFDRWAEPLDAGISRVVAVNLAVLLETQNVQVFPWRRDSIPEYAVRISVIQFAAHERDTRLVAEYAITRPKTAESVSHNIRQFTTVASTGDPESIAAAYSTLLLQLSEDIAAELRAVPPAADS